MNLIKFCSDLFPLNRSLTGSGNVATLRYIQNILPELNLCKYKSGTHIFDWVVPDEWEIHDAYIADLNGNRIVDFNQNNLHVVGYSVGVDKVMRYAELLPYLHVHPSLPDAIPYLTSYYEKTFGFCLTQSQFNSLDQGSSFRVVIDARHFSGELVAGELYLPGKTTKEILFTTYICHPSMGNNELSGPSVLTALAKWLQEKSDRYFSYRFSFHPETIGALCFIHKNQQIIQKNVIGAWNFTCMGGPEEFTILPSVYGNSMPDLVTKKVLAMQGYTYNQKSFNSRGSDERQFSSPRLGIPMVSIMRSAYGEYAQYHTSKDDLDFISEHSLQESLSIMKKIVENLEVERYFRSTVIGEPFLAKRQLYETLGGTKVQEFKSRDILNVLQYCDGRNSRNNLSQLAKLPLSTLDKILKLLLTEQLID